MDLVQKAIYRGHLRTVEDAIETWKFEYEDAEKVKDIEAIVAEWQWLAKLLLACEKNSWEKARAGKIRNYLEIGKAIRDNGFRAALELFDKIKDGVEWAESKGYVVEESDAFRSMGMQIQKSEKEFERKWPWPMKEHIDLALASFERGEGIDLGEWIHELQNKSCSASS